MRHIKGYKGLYNILPCGKILNSKGEELSTAVRDGYLRVCLYKKGKRKFHSVHVLVAHNYLTNRNKLPVVNHKDGDRSNCHKDNLEYVTQSDNVKHGFKNGRSKKRKKYCPKVVDKATKLKYNDGYSLREISSKLEVNLNTIRTWFRRLENATL